MIRVSRYLLFSIFFICCLAGCSPKQDKAQTVPICPASEAPFVDYNYGDFEDAVDLNDATDVYHVKYIHIIL